MLATLTAVAAPAQTPRPSLDVTRLPAGTRIDIDGVLAEPVWATVARLSPLTQVDPVEGAKPTRPTEVRICYDEDYLYLALRCDDDPADVRARLMARDANLDPDDRVEFWIDTFFDQRFAFWFQIGAGGSRGDALIAGNGDRFNKSWDGIWYGRSRVTASGWQAEVALPFKTLAFKRGNSTWGFNLRRLRKANDEDLRWASPLVAYRFFQVSRGGELRGLTGMRQGIGLDVVPYVKGSLSRDRSASRPATTTGDLGVDVDYRLSPELRLVLTYNTDFAETEVDERQVNLTRFPLFFPEKRDFFLADAGLFEFGIPSGFRRGGRGRGGSAPIPFFSRRIGLDDDGNAVPIVAGGKLVGRVDDWNVGVLGNVLEAQDPSPEQSVGVARVSHNIGAESSVGMIVTGGAPDRSGRSWTGGVDFKFGNSAFFGPGQSLDAWGYILGTSNAGPGGDGGAWGLQVRHQSSEWFNQARIVATGNDFDPALGFVRRTGQREYAWTTRYRWRNQNGGLLREVSLRLSPTFRTFSNNATESWRVSFNWLDIELDSGDRIEVDSRREFEYLPEPFEIQDGLFVPRGSYLTTGHTLSVRSSNRRAVQVDAELQARQFFDGNLTRWELEGTVRPNPWLELSASYEQFRVRLDEGRFTTRLIEGRADFSFSPDVQLKNLVQYDSDSKELTVQSRFRWIVDPGTDVFLLGVWGWARANADHDMPLVPTTQDGTVKLVYTQRF